MGWADVFLSDEDLYQRAVREKFSTTREFKLEIRPQGTSSSERFPRLIDGKGSVNREELIFSAASNNWQTAPDGTINVIDQLPALIQADKPLHIVTYQNGIRNSIEDFRAMGTKIVEQIVTAFKYAPLVLGFYNPTYGLVVDTNRATDHLTEEVSAIVERTRIIFRELIKKLQTMTRNLKWLHIAHSEGGGIARRVLDTLSNEEKEWTRQHLITAAYGPLRVIPVDLALHTYNTYSDGDNTTKRYANLDRGKREVLVSIVRSKNPPKTFLPPGDHSFLGETYQEVLTRNLKALKRELEN